MSEQSAVKTPTVSVVMSVFNGERFLRKSVDSILGQTFHDFEFIVIDDGSSDSTPLILDYYRDERLHIVRQANKGLTYSLQKGLELSQGEFFARQDADDVSLGQRLEVQVRYLERHPDVGVVGVGTNEIDENGEFVRSKRLPHRDSDARIRLVKSSPLVHGSIMARTQLLRQVGGYRLQFPIGQDRDLWFRAAECAGITNIPEVMYLWRLHASSVSATRRMQQVIWRNMATEMAIMRLLGGRDPLGYRWQNGHGLDSRLYARQRIFVGMGLLRKGEFAIGFRLVLGSLKNPLSIFLDHEFLLSKLGGSLLTGVWSKYRKWRPKRKGLNRGDALHYLDYPRSE